MKKLICVLVLFFIFTQLKAKPILPIEANPPLKLPNPWIAGTLSAVFPGAGYFYNGDVAGGLVGVGVAIPLMGGQFLPSPQRSSLVAAQVSLLSRNAYGYLLFDSYQQALDLNGRPTLKINHPRYSPIELLMSPLKPTNYRFKRVWIPLLVGAAGVVANVSSKGVVADGGRLAIGIPLTILQALVIGAGEESEFRGFYHPAFSELSGSRVVGNLAQASLFGLCHTTIPGCASPQLTGLAVRQLGRGSLTNSVVNDGTDFGRFAGTFLFGMIAGWVAGDPEAGLPSSIAFHAAWDAMQLIGDLMTTNESPLYFSMSFAF